MPYKQSDERYIFISSPIWHTVWRNSMNIQLSWIQGGDRSSWQQNIMKYLKLNLDLLYVSCYIKHHYSLGYIGSGCVLLAFMSATK